MEDPASRQKTARRYAFACLKCRRRKLRCDGEQPECRRCRRSGETCEYPQRATDGMLEKAQQRITELEDRLACVEQAVSSVTPENNTADSQHAQHPDTESDEDDDLAKHIGLDENGHVTYHGPTSRFYAAAIEHGDAGVATTPASLRNPLDLRHSLDLQRNTQLLHNVWQPLLETKAEDELGIEPGLAQRLLNIYWTWQHPLHNYVYKPSFISGLALGGPYCSKFLLFCIYALAARHLEADSVDNQYANKGETFLGTARALLVDELSALKPRIPTIQGLLILGGRQCAVGKTSEGWIFTGMALRMMTDLGLHLNVNRLAELERLTAVDVEVRKRLYCSAYIWDKSLSLSLGRAPGLSRLPGTVLDLFDHADDHVIWQPAEFPDYLPTKAQNTICFMSFCKLGQIVESLMVTGRSISKSRIQEGLSSTLEQKLRRWWDELPSVLKMDGANQCPPPHILSLNLLYHTLQIVMWRPYIHSTHSQDRKEHYIARCVAEAQIIHDIFVLYGRSFAWKKMTYLVSYCVYTAATVDVEIMKTTDSLNCKEAAKRLAVSLRILESEAKSTPGIRRSICIIKQQLRTWSPVNLSSERGSFQHADGHAFKPEENRSTIIQGDLKHIAPGPDFTEQPYTARAASMLHNSDSGNDGHQAPLANDQFAFPGLPGGFDLNTGAGFHPDAFPWTELDENMYYSDADYFHYNNT